MNNFKYFFTKNSSLRTIIIVNLIVFSIINILNVIFYLMNEPFVKLICLSTFNKLTYFLALPASLNKIIFAPWTLITYMFTHEDIWHILFNMLMLFFAGQLFVSYLGSKRMLGVYFLGGISGAIFFILSYNIFPVFSNITECSIAIGASASVLAIVVSIATYSPNIDVYLFGIFKLKLKYLAILLVVMDIFSISKSNPGGHLAHLGGATFGFFYIISLRKGFDLVELFNFKKFSSIFKKKSKIKVSYRSDKPMSDEEYNLNRVNDQRRMDAILDKISKSGYESLSKEEKDFLFKASNKK